MTTGVSCIITVKGDGKGAYGKLKHDKAAPLSEFLVDSDFLYGEVTKHVLGSRVTGAGPCPVCDPEEILRYRLARRLRMAEKFGGMTSTGLVKHVLSWEKRLAKSGRPLPRDLVDEFVWRSGWAGVRDHGLRLTVRQRFEALRLGPPHAGANMSSSDRYLAKLAAAPLGSYEDMELEDLIAAAEVLLS